MSTIHRGKLDVLMSNLVRCSTNYTCEHCGKHYPATLRRGIHCSHYWGRAIKQLRFSELNCSALCYGCHMRMTSDPWAHTQFMRQKIGNDTLIELSKIAYASYKFKAKDQDAALMHLVEQWQMMSERRRKGETGIIKYQGWMPTWTRQ